MTRFSIAFTALFLTGIAIRHDVDDARYIELGEAYPSVVRVGSNGGDGTLIAPEWVLTAAHVAEGMVRRVGKGLRVFVDGEEVGYRVKQVVLHPGFTPMGPDDIALLRLERPVEGIVPAGLYRQTDEEGRPIVLVGHGDTKRGDGGEWTADRIRRGATNVIDEANDTHLVFDFDAPGEATELEGTAGPGDSGGPAFIEIDGEPLVAGVSSLGEPGEKGPGTYGAREHYVRVSTYITWIDSIMAHPPEGSLVNMPARDRRADERRIVSEGPNALPPGVVALEEIGLLIAERDGAVRMVGRIDELYPDALLAAGIRPPARLFKINEVTVEAIEAAQSAFAAIKVGEAFSLEFEHRGEFLRFELVK